MKLTCTVYNRYFSVLVCVLLMVSSSQTAILCRGEDGHVLARVFTLRFSPLVDGFDDGELVGRIRERYGDSRWMFIPNTLHLGEMYATEDLRQELETHPLCEIDPEPVELSFDGGRINLDFTSG